MIKKNDKQKQRVRCIRFIILITLIALLFSLPGCAIKEKDISRGIQSFLFPTAGTVVDEDGTIQIETSLDGNRFSYIVLQLYEDGFQKHLKNIDKSNEGKSTGLYYHKLPTGYYMITLKANSNLADEGVNSRVFLINGASYTYSYNVIELEEKLAVIKDYSFRKN